MPADPSSDALTAVASPCTGICRMDAADRWCEGCLRSRDEIAAWSQLSPLEQRALRAQLTQRRSHLTALQTASTPDTCG